MNQIRHPHVTINNMLSQSTYVKQNDTSRVRRSQMKNSAPVFTVLALLLAVGLYTFFYLYTNWSFYVMWLFASGGATFFIYAVDKLQAVLIGAFPNGSYILLFCWGVSVGVGWGCFCFGTKSESRFFGWS